MSLRFVIVGLSSVQGLAVDWMASNIYWIQDGNRIEMAKVDGRHRRLLVIKENAMMQFLLVNPKKRYVTWNIIPTTE